VRFPEIIKLRKLENGGTDAFRLTGEHYWYNLNNMI
jgi:hypothetical protein